MGLDLAALSKQMREMSNAAVREIASTAQRAEQALTRYMAAVGEEERWARAVDLSRETSAWLLARPVERLDTVRQLPPAPPAYAVVATDGSQIDLERRGRMSCYVINIGQVFIRYGERPTARLTSRPMLGYRDEDLYLSDGVRRVAIEGNYLSVRRDVEEGLALADLAETWLEGDLPALALQDGTLVRWTLAGAERFVQEHFLERYLGYLERMRTRGVPTASYISRPRSPEVVGTIRLMLCPDVDVAAGRGARCSECSDVRAGREPSCMLCQGLVDADVFAPRLAEGQRGPLFVSMSAVNIERYGEHCIHFFHLRVGREIGRVEIPGWVAQAPEQVDLVHSLVYDQCVRGGGYPVALARAHDQAVIRSHDRRAFLRMLEGSLARTEVQHDVSAKQASKEFSRL